MEIKIKDKNLYYVGGVVRDEILGQQSLDIDLCYEGNAIVFSKKYNVIKTNPDFGTVRILEDNILIDIASTRKEDYPKPGHLPIVKEIGCSLKDDLKRRDFTINALAKNSVNNKITDYFNGLDDLKNKKLRVLHDNSFIDDPTRIIRGLKFRTRFGFELDNHTKKLQEEYLENINYDMCYHRIKKELKETFNQNKNSALEIFINEKIYKLLGENQQIPTIRFSIEDLVQKYSPKNIWLVYLGGFNLQNIELTNEEKEIINSFNLIKDLEFKSDYKIYKSFKNIPLESILLYAAFCDIKTATKFLDELRNIKIPIKGDDLLEIGFEQGKKLKDALDYAIEVVIENNKIEKKDLINKIRDKFLC